jgi:CRISPR-associated protein Cas2
MMVLVSYDVSTKTPAGKRRLQRVARICGDFGQRVQNSVFECNVDPAQWAEMRHRLEDVYNKDEDSLRYYFLGSNWERRVEHIGAKPAVDMEGPLIV